VAVVNPAPTLVAYGLLLQMMWKTRNMSKIELLYKKRLEAMTKTKRGNFGSLPPTDTMLGPTPLY
jgi:hypothetical protein